MNVMTAIALHLRPRTSRRTFRRADRRRRHLRHRQRLSADQRSSRTRSFVILETQESFGGTWLTHRYPGIRSDSDLHTFGYSFKPWVGPPIATAAEIRAYMGEVIAENDLARHIRYRHRIDRASWSSETNLWTIEAVRTDSGEAVDLHREFPLDVPGLLPAFRRLHAGMAGHGQVQGPHRASAALAGRSRRSTARRSW